MRPLVDLTADQAKLAWERAVERAGARPVTARMVKAAVQELQFGGAPKPASYEPRQSKAEERSGFAESFCPKREKISERRQRPAGQA